jgi:hypothetical protein
MPLIEDMFKGNLATGLAVGVGTVLLGPTAIRTVGITVRSAAKAVIKSGLIFYHETLSELGEVASDIIAEARAELEQGTHSGETGSNSARRWPDA